MLATNPVLIGFEILAASIWIGSLVCLAVVASSARHALDPAARVAFFRSVGRRYSFVGNGALAVTIGVGLAMIWSPSSWGRLEDTLVALAGALVVVSILGEVQARAMTRLRRRSVADAANEDLARRVHRGSAAAGMLRGLIAAITLAGVAVVAALIGN